MKSIQIKEIKKYQTEDGSVFDTEQEATEYAQLCSNGLYKKLVERVQKLEQELVALKLEVATKSWEPRVAINRPPYPTLDNGVYTVPLSHEAYNQATGKPEKDTK